MKPNTIYYILVALVTLLLIGAFEYDRRRQELPKWTPPKVSEQSQLADRIHRDYAQAKAINDKLQTMQLQIDLFRVLPPYLWGC